MKELKNEGIILEDESIKKSLKGHNSYSAIAEYIWNGLDANATEIKISLIKNELGRVIKIIILDNGSGIVFENLNDNFKKFKISEKNSEFVHGKKGEGRFSFFVFSNFALWETTYKLNDKTYSYEIKMDSDLLNQFRYSEKIESSKNDTFTKVSFDIKENVEILENYLINHLKKIFPIYLKIKNANIYINENRLNWEEMILFEENTLQKEISVRIKEGTLKKCFDIDFISWKSNVVSENSEYIYCNSSTLKFKEPTRFNRKGDSFKHTVIIKSDFFDTYTNTDNLEDNQEKLFGNVTHEKLNRKIFKELRSFLESLIIKERKKVLKNNAKKMITQYKEQKVFPTFSNEPWEKVKEQQYEDFISEIYIIEPKIFKDLKSIHLKTLFKLFYSLIFSKEKEALLEILESVISLDEAEISEFKEILSRNSLQNIMDTIKFIENRYKVIEQLKELVFNKELNVYEVEHIQKVVENHFWIFGEQYNLVTSAEPSFKTALKEYWEKIIQAKNIETVTHNDALKEMDLFISRRDLVNGKIRNIVVELKRPKVKLNKEIYRQLEDYKEVILNTPAFNAHNEEWIFILIGTDFSDNFIEGKYDAAKSEGEQFLTEKGKNYKIYVKKWSELFSELEVRHNFIMKNLDLEKEKLLSQNFNEDPDDIVNNIVYETTLN